MGSSCDSVPTVNSSSSSSTVGMSSIAPFLSKTYDMVDDPSTNDVVSWSNGNNSFVVWNVPEFSKQFLPKYFKHNNFSSFVRQLNTYGFRKVDSDRWEFANEGFLRGQKQRLKSIIRRKPSQIQPPQQPQVQHSSVGACLEVGKFGLDEEVERLHRDKNVLMQELVRLRQQQEVAEHHLQDVVHKVHVMEQRQQQMMSFLAKAVQSPGFLNQFSQQQQQQQQQQQNSNNIENNGNNRHTSESNKKRRLPVDGLSSQQIVKYQSSSMNEEAHRRESVSNNNHGSFRLRNVSNSNSSDNGSSSNGIYGGAFADVSSNPAMKYHNQVPKTSLPYGSPNSGCEVMDNGECFNPIMAVMEEEVEVDGGVQQDSLWEQFFGEIQNELISGSVENEVILEQLQLQSNLRNVWSKNQQQMNHLTEQMGHLSSDSIL